MDAEILVFQFQIICR